MDALLHLICFAFLLIPFGFFWCCCGGCEILCDPPKPAIDVLILGNFGEENEFYPQCCEDIPGLYTLDYDADYTASLGQGECGWTFYIECDGNDIEFKMFLGPWGTGYRWVLQIYHRGVVSGGQIDIPAVDCDANLSGPLSVSSPFVDGCRLLENPGTFEINPE